MRTTAVLAVLAGLAVAAPPAAAHTINVGRFTVSGIGDFRPGTDPYIGAAERVFGPASSKRRSSAGVCTVRWRALRLKMLFVNLGEPGADTCRDNIGKAQSFVARGRQFRTWRGLRVGQRRSAIRQRHPSARLRRGWWWVKTVRNPIGDGSASPVVEAKVSRGRVAALRGWIGSAGD